MTTRAEVLTRAAQLSQGAGRSLGLQVTEARHLAFEGDYAGAMTILDDVELARHPALAAGGPGGGISREQGTLTGLDGGNGSPAEFTISEATDPFSLTVADDTDITFQETGLWVINAFWSFVGDGGNVTAVDLSIQHQGQNDFNYTHDSFFHIEPQSAYEHMTAWTCWFEEGCFITLAPGWLVDAGSAIPSVTARMVRLA